jgi:mannose-1-phosphate guanylyltransferase
VKRQVNLREERRRSGVQGVAGVQEALARKTQFNANRAHPELLDSFSLYIPRLPSLGCNPFMAPRIRTAFVLGAGLGTRLRPLTDLVPKPLLPIFGKPIITFALDHLIAYGVERFVINSHHLAAQISRLFNPNSNEQELGPTGRVGSYRGKEVQLIYEPALLETGGGIWNAASLIGDEPFFVYSGDVLTDLDLGRLVDAHFSSGCEVTLALRTTGLGTDISFDTGTGLVVDVRQILKSGIAGVYDFANVSIWSSAAIAQIPPDKKISFIPVLVDWIRQGGRVGGAVLEEDSWFNVGNRSEYLRLHRVIAREGWRPAYLTEANWPASIDPAAKVSPGAEISDDSWVGANSLIESDAKLRNAIAWPNSIIRTRVELTECIVAGREVGEGIFDQYDFV